MQKKAPFTVITKPAALSGATHGQRAKCIQRLIRLDMPVPQTVSLDFDTVHAIANGTRFDLTELLASFGPDPLVSVRPSPEFPEWGGPSTVLDVGMNDALLVSLSEKIGSDAARSIYLRFILGFSIEVARLDPELFDDLDNSRESLLSALEIYQEEMDEPFPQSPDAQLAAVLRSMARTWEGPTARLLRQSRATITTSLSDLPSAFVHSTLITNKSSLGALIPASE